MTNSRQVLIVQGSVYVVDARAARRLLRAGEQIGEHERLELAPGARVSLQQEDGRIVTLDGAPPPETAPDTARAWRLDEPGHAADAPKSRAKQSLALAFDDPGEVLLRARAESGLSGSDVNRGGHGFVRVARIDERVTLSHGVVAHGDDEAPRAARQILASDDAALRAPVESHSAPGPVRVNRPATISGQLRIREHQDAVSQQLGISDPDPGEARFQTTVLPLGDADQYVTATITAEGLMTVTSKDNDTFCLLREGEELTIYFRVFSSDGSSQDVPVTLIGVNDKPTISAHPVELTEEALQAFVSALKPEAVAQQGGRVKRSIQVDVTKGETIMSHPNDLFTSQCMEKCQQLFAQSHTNPNLKGIMMPNAVDATKNGVTRLTIGERDAKGFLANELTIVDKDQGQSEFASGREVTAKDEVAKYGVFVFNKDTKTLVFFLNKESEDVKMLKATDKPITLEYEVTSVDGTKHTISVDITGVDARISGVKGGNITEEADDAPRPVNLTGQLEVIGGGQAESVFSTVANVVAVTGLPPGENATTYAAKFGQFTINSSGQWTFVPGGALWGSLAANETRDFSYQVSNADGTAIETVTVHLVGTNSRPTIEVLPIDQLPPGVVPPPFVNTKSRSLRSLSDEEQARAPSIDEAQNDDAALVAADVLQPALTSVVGAVAGIASTATAVAEVGAQPALESYLEPSALLVA